jgi:hypothetical protein
MLSEQNYLEPSLEAVMKEVRKACGQVEGRYRPWNAKFHHQRSGHLRVGPRKAVIQTFEVGVEMISQEVHEFGLARGESLYRCICHVWAEPSPKEESLVYGRP